MFEQFLADIRSDGDPSKVVIARSDQLRGREFVDLCRSRDIKQKFVTANSPQFNGVAERALCLIERVTMSCSLQALER